jgi:hypothetical protein
VTTYFTGELTVIMWVNIIAFQAASSSLFFCTDQNTNNELRLQLVATTNKLNFYTKPNNAFVANIQATSYTIPTGTTWTHLAVTLSATSSKIYADGVQVATGTGGTAPDTPKCYIGGAPNYAVYSNANYDEIKFFSRALSATEITADYNTGSLNSFVTAIAAA